jgi:Zn-dependent protease
LNTLQSILFVAPVLLFSVIAHEYAHGYAAMRQGDPTAHLLGRLTWNPIKHIDPFMTILLPLMLGYSSHWRVVLGGAKPVPVNPRNYRDPVRGDIIVSLAGVAANLAIAIGCTIGIALVGVVARMLPVLEGVAGVVQAMLIIGISLNLLLFAFNLIPIPPLDGSHVVKHLLPPRWAVYYQRVGTYGIVLLVAVLWFRSSWLMAWMAPVFAAGDAVQHLLGPLLVPGLQR